MRWTFVAAVVAPAILSACSDPAGCYEWYAPCTVTCPDQSSRQPEVSTCAPSFEAGGPPVGPATFCLYDSNALALCASSPALVQIVCECTPWVSTITTCECPP